ncbi:MAG: sigma-70 family RNA polymerase sigma factor [Clostridia bacterium]|nr:sigma-70 family RNA polymerase sigma factor [Clostridia bacterium]
MNFDKLALKIAEHDKRAFELLYEQTRRLVFSVCLGVVKNQGVAEELTQETFVTVWQRSGEFRGNGYKTWILTVAKHKSINALKKNRRETPIDFFENERAGGSYEVDADTGIVLKTALRALDDDERQIVLMRNAGLKAKEIAEMLGIPRGTVSWKYAEALKKLKKLLEG